MREPRLSNSSPEYLATIRGGLSMVLNGILLSVVLAIASVGVNFALPGSPEVRAILGAAGLCISAMMLLGYWRFTVPDPGQVAHEAVGSARSVLRMVVLAQTVMALIGLLVSFTAPQPAGVPVGLIMLLGIGLLLLNLGLWAVQFFVVMRYTRWIATRIPDAKVVARTKRYMWLLPVLYVPGMILLMLGPLIALILYWNLLDRVRKHLVQIIKTGSPATF